MVGGQGEYSTHSKFFTPFDINGSQNQYFGRNVAIAGDRVVIGFGNSNQRKLYHYDANDTNGSLISQSNRS